MILSSFLLIPLRKNIMFGEPDNNEIYLVLLDNLSLEDIISKLEIDPVEVLRVLDTNGYDIIGLYEEVINGNG